jgi:hypothetical protein
MQVVVPSVSLADRPQGTNFVFAAARSSPESCGGGPPGRDITPVAGSGGTAGGGAKAGGGDSEGASGGAPGACCAKPADDPIVSISPIGKAAIRMKASLHQKIIGSFATAFSMNLREDQGPKAQAAGARSTCLNRTHKRASLTPSNPAHDSQIIPIRTRVRCSLTCLRHRRLRVRLAPSPASHFRAACRTARARAMIVRGEPPSEDARTARQAECRPLEVSAPAQGNR